MNNTIVFDNYLHTNIERTSDRAVRESDLFAGLKLFCQRHGCPCPTWQEYHRFLKERNANKQLVDGKMMITGVDWKDGAEDRPREARDYILRMSVQREEQLGPSEEDNKHPVVFDDVPPWEE